MTADKSKMGNVSALQNDETLSSLPPSHKDALTLNYPLNNVICCSFLPVQKYSQNSPFPSIYRWSLETDLPCGRYSIHSLTFAQIQ